MWIRPENVYTLRVAKRQGANMTALGELSEYMVFTSEPNEGLVSRGLVLRRSHGCRPQAPGTLRRARAAPNMRCLP